MVCHYGYIDTLQLGHNFYQIFAVPDNFGTRITKQGYQLQFFETD